MGGFSVRAATDADADRIAGVHVACWHETYRGMLPDALLDGMDVSERAVMWRGVFAAFGQGALGAVYVAEREGEIVGFGGYSGLRDQPLLAQGYDSLITALYVRQIAQRQGVGRLLLGACAAGMRAAGCAAPALWVLRQNARARAFYQAMGAVECGEEDEVRDGHVLQSVAYGWPDLRVLAGA